MSNHTARRRPSPSRFLTTAFLTVLAFLALPLHATADSRAPETSDTVSSTTSSTATEGFPVPQLTEAEAAELEAEVAHIQAHLSEGLELDYAAAAADDRVSTDTLKDYAVGIIASGGSVIGAGTEARSIESDAADLVAEVGVDGAATLACEGRNDWAAVPPTIYLSSCNATALSASLAAGAAIATIAAMITSWTGAGAAVAGAIAAALGLYSSIYAICNSWGHGIRIYVVSTLPVCWSQ